MGEREFPGSGPGEPVIDCYADSDFDEWAAWLDREIAAGRDPVPPEQEQGIRAIPERAQETRGAPEQVREIPGQAEGAQGISVSLGDAADIDRELLAAICGPESVDAGKSGPQFTQDSAADVLPPSPVLAALTEAAVADVSRLNDDQLIGVLQAARRQENREAWKKALVIAELARRRESEFEAAAARGVPVHCRPGQFPGEELAAELLLGPVQASHAIDDATDLATRLPKTLAGMAAGLIDEARAGVIALYTRDLSPDDTALADDILAAMAPELRLDQLARKAAALEMKLAPEAVKARREHARRTRQRVEIRREESGNALVAGREMDTADALAARAHIHSLALRLRRAGMPGTLDQLRLLAFTDLTAGRDPLDRLPRDAGQDKIPASPGNPATSTSAPGHPAPGHPAPGHPAPGGRASDDRVRATADHGPADAAGSPPDGDREPPSTDETREGAEPANRDHAAHGRNRARDGGEFLGGGRMPPADDRNQDDISPRALGGERLYETPVGDGSRTGGFPQTTEQDAWPGLMAGRVSRGPGSSGDGPVFPDYDHDDGEEGNGEPGSAAHARPPDPMPATINLLVHAGTLFGWDTAPGEAGGWGLLDAEETRAIVAAASRHPATRWCFTLLGADGTAAAHGCAPGHHPWVPGDPWTPVDPWTPGGRHDARPPDRHAPNPGDPAGLVGFGGDPGTHHTPPSGTPDSLNPPGTASCQKPPAPSTTGRRTPTPAQAAQLAAFLRSLNVTLAPIAKGNCEHAAAEPRYTPSRKLAHFVRARTATCDAPGCAAQAVHADLDHTAPYPDGLTDQCNLGPKCRRHHKAKQTPGWKVEQPEPGIIRWTLPNGRTHTTRPTVYDFIG